MPSTSIISSDIQVCTIGSRKPNVGQSSSGQNQTKTKTPGYPAAEGTRLISGALTFALHFSVCICQVTDLTAAAEASTTQTQTVSTERWKRKGEFCIEKRIKTGPGEAGLISSPACLGLLGPRHLGPAATPKPSACPLWPPSAGGPCPQNLRCTRLSGIPCLFETRDGSVRTKLEAGPGEELSRGGGRGSVAFFILIYYINRSSVTL